LLIILSGSSLIEKKSILEIKNNYVKKPLIGINATSAYFEVKNLSDRKVVIEEINCNEAKRTSFHKILLDESTGTMKMEMMKFIELEPNEEKAFVPMSDHLMIMGLSPDFGSNNKIECSVLVNQNKTYWSFPLK